MLFEPNVVWYSFKPCFKYNFENLYLVHIMFSEPRSAPTSDFWMMSRLKIRFLSHHYLDESHANL